MAIKLVVSDIDGTLIQSDGSVNPINIKAISQLEEQGIHFALATGRSFDGASEVYKQLNLPNTSHRLICLNGMRTYLSDGNLLKQFHTLNYEDALDLMRLGQEFYQGILYCFDDVIYFQMDERSYLDFTHGLGSDKLHYFQKSTETVRIDHLSEIKYRFDQGDLVLKVVFIQNEEYLNMVLNRIRNRLPSNFDIMLVGLGWAEIMPNHISKGNAVEALAQQYGIDLSEVMVFGDAENDISMFKKAGIAVAMENAMASVKDVADRITENNNVGGVGLEILRLIEKENQD